MTVFEQLIDKTIQSVEKWTCKADVAEVTIIRDITGRIALLLDAARSFTQIEKDQLENILMADIGKYYRGNIYYRQEKNNDLVQGMITEIEKMRWTYDISGKIQYYLLERAIAKKAWVEYSGTEKAIWDYTQAVNGDMPKVVTFYSFKGGMGRTTALAAAAINLAKKGKNILMIDTDIEAPGLPSLFFDEGRVKRGVIDYLLEAVVTPDGEKVDMRDMLYQVADPQLMKELTGRLFVIPSGAMDDNYLQKLARIDYQDAVPGNMKKQMTRLVKDAIEVIKTVCRIDYVLLDSRAGFHDMGGVTTIQLPHGVVLFGKDSTQSWQGMSLVVRAIGASQEERPFIAIVDSACGAAGTVSQEEKDSFKEQAYTVCCSSYYTEDEGQPGIDAKDVAHSPIFVPYQPILSSDIRLFTDGTQKTDERIDELSRVMQGDYYREIVERIEQWFETEESGDE